MVEPLILIYACADLCLALQISLSNLVVIWVYVKSRHVRTPTNAYIFSLAIADFLAGALGIPTTVFSVLTREPRQFLPCLTVHLCLCMLCTISTFHLLAIAIDKYLTICCKRCQLFDQHHASRHKRSKMLIALAWILGSAVGGLPLFDAFGFASNPRRTFTDECHFTKVVDYRYLVYVIFFGTIIAPTIVIAFCYTAIYSTIRIEERQIKCLLRAAERQRRIHNRRKIIRIMMILVLTYAFCWYPLYLLNTMDFYFPSDSWLHSTPLTTLAAVVLSHLNCALNPLIYAYGVPGFKHSLRRFLPLNDPVTITVGGSGIKHYYVYDTAGGITPPYYSQLHNGCHTYKYSPFYGGYRDGVMVDTSNGTAIRPHHNAARGHHHHHPRDDHCRTCGQSKTITINHKSENRDLKKVVMAVAELNAEPTKIVPTDDLAKFTTAQPKPNSKAEQLRRSLPLLNLISTGLNRSPKQMKYAPLSDVHRRAKSLDEAHEDMSSEDLSHFRHIRSSLLSRLATLQRRSSSAHVHVDDSNCCKQQRTQQNSSDQNHSAGEIARRYLFTPIKEFLNRSGMREHRKSDSGMVLGFRHHGSMQASYITERHANSRKSAIEVDLTRDYPILLSKLANADNCRCISTSTTTSSTCTNEDDDDESCGSINACSDCRLKFEVRRCRASQVEDSANVGKIVRSFTPLKNANAQRKRLSTTFRDVKMQLRTLRMMKGDNIPTLKRAVTNEAENSVSNGGFLQITSTPVFPYIKPEISQNLTTRRHTTQPEFNAAPTTKQFPMCSPLKEVAKFRCVGKFSSEPIVQQAASQLDRNANMPISSHCAPSKKASEPARVLFDLMSDSEDMDITADDLINSNYAGDHNSKIYNSFARKNCLNPIPFSLSEVNTTQR